MKFFPNDSSLLLPGMGNYNKFVVEFASVFWDENVTMLGVTPVTENITGMMADWVNLYPVSGKYPSNRTINFTADRSSTRQNITINCLCLGVF